MAITTGRVRLSYCHVWQPQAKDGDDPKYSVTMLIPKSDVRTLNAIYAEMEVAKQKGVTEKWGGVTPPIVKTPLYDGDGVRPSGEPFGVECRGHMVMTASCKNQPTVVDLQVQPILNPAEVYSGCYARVNFNFFAYAQSGNKGIGCGLNCIQKLEDGESLAGGVSAAEAFGGSNAYTGAASQTFAQPTAPQYGAPPMQAPQYAPQSPPPQTGYGVPVPQAPQTPQTFQSLDPITGAPPTGGVMGM